jgi:hypothetical protein
MTKSYAMHDTLFKPSINLYILKWKISGRIARPYLSLSQRYRVQRVSKLVKLADAP